MTEVSEAVRTSKTSVNIYQTTRRNIPEDNHLNILFTFKYVIKELTLYSQNLKITKNELN
jgi:hypothetical protein